MKKIVISMLLIGGSLMAQPPIIRPAATRFELNTTGNKVGIPENDTCYLWGQKTITCDSGKTIEDVGTEISSVTGTPGHLMYSNYVGSYTQSQPTAGLAGSGKRVDVCEGACQKAE